MRKLHIITAIFAAIAGGSLCSCNEYSDEIQGIGKRVTVLEDSVLAVQNTLETLMKLEAAMQENGVIKQIITNKDGSTTLEFTDGREPITFVCGANGTEAELLLGVEKDTDGHYYWTFNDTWLTDDDGNKISAEPKNGKDGADGKDGKDADPVEGELILPQVRINEGTRIWEISTDGGKTWRSTGVNADGQDGRNGRNGKDGRDGNPGKDGVNGKDGTGDPVVFDARISSDGRYLILTVLVTNEDGEIEVKVIRLLIA